MTDQGWYPDPFGRFPHRYHDSTTWTNKVVRNGVSAVDEPDGQPTAVAAPAAPFPPPPMAPAPFPASAYPPPPGPAYPPVGAQKSKVAAGLFGILLGALGIHRFYLGYTGLGLTMLLISVLSFGLLAPFVALWGFIEGIMILAGSSTFSRDARGVPLGS
jgi:hypothetical protein